MIHLTCVHCGHHGNDVRYTASYVGGHGYKAHPVCTDRPACWRRWEEREAAKEKVEVVA